MATSSKSVVSPEPARRPGPATGRARAVHRRGASRRRASTASSELVPLFDDARLDDDDARLDDDDARFDDGDVNSDDDTDATGDDATDTDASLDDDSSLAERLAILVGEFESDDASTARVRRKAKRKAEDQASFLAMYFREMAALDVLKPEEEFTAAREIEALEITVWEEILSYAPVADHVLKVVETCMDNALVEFRGVRRAAMAVRKSNTKVAQRKLVTAAGKCADKLRAIDTDKQYLEKVLEEVERIAEGNPDPTGRRKLSFSHQSRVFCGYMDRVRHADRAAAGARNAFVKANLRLVVSIARRFNHGRMALADLIQEGNIGLMKAVERYDYRRGFRFSTYASWWIRHAISRALADKGREVRLPVHMIDAHHRLSKAKRELTAKLGRDPNTEELAEAAQIPAEKVEKMRTYLIDQSFSLDRPVNEEDGRSFVEFLRDPVFEDNSPSDVLALQALTDEVRRMLAELKPIEADILRQRFGLDNDHELTLKQIGEKYNLSRERIRQLQEQALTKMRRALQRKNMM